MVLAFQGVWLHARSTVKWVWPAGAGEKKVQGESGTELLAFCAKAGNGLMWEHNEKQIFFHIYSLLSLCLKQGLDMWTRPARTHYIIQTGLEIAILFPLPPEWWDYCHVSHVFLVPIAPRCQKLGRVQQARVEYSDAWNKRTKNHFQKRWSGEHILVLRNKLKERRSVRDSEMNRTYRINTIKVKFLDWLIRYSQDNVPMAVLILQRLRT